MIVGIGSDLCNIERIQNSLDRFGVRFEQRVFTDVEQAKANRRPFTKAGTLAKRFAAKEAASKALGTGFSQGITFTHFEILSNTLGRPTLTFHGPARERAAALGATAWHVSITHERATAAAVVVLEG